MHYIRPFDATALDANGVQLLLEERDGAGCTITLCRGGSPVNVSTSPQERFALVLEGALRLEAGDGVRDAAAGDLAFIPAGIAGSFEGAADAVWIEVQAPLQEGSAVLTTAASVTKVDQARFEGEGFAYQSLIDRNTGAATMRMNVLQVQPGSGSPDYHIHAFAQIYVIQEGAMTLDIGRRRFSAGAGSIVFLPAGVVHRNFNASGMVERHVSLLVPEPRHDEVFDYAVKIFEEEAQLLTSIPE